MSTNCQAFNPFRLAIICGGPSLERGISLNSARTVVDHLLSLEIEIFPLYVNPEKDFFLISKAQLYSNTPADFDFKLKQNFKKFSLEDLKTFLGSCHLVFPLIHGSFGEDGELQGLLEEWKIPFVGHSAASCKSMFSKHSASQILQKAGFSTLPQLLVSKNLKDAAVAIENFFSAQNLTQAIVKPCAGGSSIGVYSVNSPAEALVKTKHILDNKFDSLVVIEPFLKDREFTIVVMENERGEPVALIPTEVEMTGEDSPIFDYRKKYLPSNQVVHHTPARFSQQNLDEIRMQAEKLFQLFQMRDFVRLDGWLKENGDIFFTDINPISGLDQNSFFFRQTSLIGLTHRESIEYVLKSACRRYLQAFPSIETAFCHSNKQPVFVLFGGSNAERQVSLMSGANVWLKLLNSQNKLPTPFLLDQDGSIWQLPYSYVLHHTVEEIYGNCIDSNKNFFIHQSLIDQIQTQLNVRRTTSWGAHLFDRSAFLKKAKEVNAFVFIALHGGEGEDGTWQKKLEAYNLPFNGSGSFCSALCMDKSETGEAILSLEHSAIFSLPKMKLQVADFENFTFDDFQKLWHDSCFELASGQLLIKPCKDGCSAGIAYLQSAKDLERFCQFVLNKSTFIPPFSFAKQSMPIEMPFGNTLYLLEPYIETDTIKIEGAEIVHIAKSGWIELTVGVFEQGGEYCSFNPSITIAEGAVLSLEEKFQGGTGVNLTPPPIEILSQDSVTHIKWLIQQAARALGIQNYARLDVFYNQNLKKMIIIEANTLPALTPSTVIYHQALAENPPMSPLKLLEKIIDTRLLAYA